MPLTIIVGGFFGDEGKGKIAAYLALADDADIAVRTGAPNAGHTVVWRGSVYPLRVVPAAFVNPRTQLRVAPGALVRLDVMWRELELTGAWDRFRLDRHTGVIEERHVEAERRDAYLSGKIGSTLQGVGAAMCDRVLRRLKLAKDYPQLEGMLVDVAAEVNEALDEGLTVVVEGTQGTFLSLYHGTYPYVTSRDTTASGIASEVGVGPRRVDEVLVVFKAYVTRVGAGPLPGELPMEEAARRGMLERGTVTGRPRRVAPFNFELARRAVMLNSATQIAITRIDVLYPEARGVRSWDRLPREARRWVERVEEELRVPVTLVSTGPDPLDTVDRRMELGLG